jgi:hypothetical protein
MPGRRKRASASLSQVSKKRKEGEIEESESESGDEDDEDDEPFPSVAVMQYRHLGKSGLRVSVVSLGAWVNFGEKIDDQTAIECFKTAFEAGVVCGFTVVT